MLKSEVIQAIQSRTGMPKGQVVKVVDSLLEIISDTLVLGQPVDIHGFGSFMATLRKKRDFRHPVHGKSITVPERRKVRFRPSKRFEQNINHSSQGSV